MKCPQCRSTEVGRNKAHKPHMFGDDKLRFYACHRCDSEFITREGILMPPEIEEIIEDSSEGGPPHFEGRHTAGRYTNPGGGANALLDYDD